MKKKEIDIKDFFIIKWTPIRKCNYKCSFCFHKQNEKDDISNILKNAFNIKEKVINKINDKILISISGGEISLLPLDILIKIFEILKDKKISYIYITTNFSNTPEYYNELNNWCKKNNIIFLLEASFHEEFVSKENFFNKIKLLNFEPVQVQAVVTEKNSSFMKEIKKEYPYIFFEPDFNEEIEKINFVFNDKEKIRYLQRKNNIYFGKKCFQNQIVIKENGNIFNNGCELYKYGNINNSIFIPKKQYFTCNKKECKYCYFQGVKI